MSQCRQHARVERNAVWDQWTFFLYLIHYIYILYNPCRATSGEYIIFWLLCRCVVPWRWIFHGQCFGRGDFCHCMSQTYMFKHNVNTARKCAYPFRFQTILHIWTFDHINTFFWTSICTCVSAYPWIRACILRHVNSYNAPVNILPARGGAAGWPRGIWHLKIFGV